MQVHYREILKKDWLYGEAFKGKDVDLTIKEAQDASLRNQDGDTEPCVVFKFEETPKKLVVNITNCQTIENITGTGDMDEWVGKTFTFYPLPGKWFGNKRTAIRIRPVLPKQKS